MSLWLAQSYEFDLSSSFIAKLSKQVEERVHTSDTYGTFRDFIVHRSGYCAVLIGC